MSLIATHKRHRSHGQTRHPELAGLILGLAFGVILAFIALANSVALQ